MSNELILGFLLGILSAFISEYVLFLFKSKVYYKIISKRKYKHILGRYSHSIGKVEIAHLKGNNFQAIGIENSGETWNSTLLYLENSILTGVYDWKPNSGLNDWGEHYLHILPNGDISVIWRNKSVEKELSGRLIWIKQRQ